MGTLLRGICLSQTNNDEGKFLHILNYIKSVPVGVTYIYFFFLQLLFIVTEKGVAVNFKSQKEIRRGGIT